MKIRTQLYLTAACFGLALLIIAASVITTTAQLDRLDGQLELANQVGLAGADLNYLASEYLLYGEPQQVDRWNVRYASLSDDLANLSTGSPEQQALVTTIAGDQQRLKAVFDEVLAGNQGGSPAAADPAALQVSWSRLGVQTQGLVYDASRLSALLGNEADGLQSRLTLLIAALLGTFSVFLLTSYLVVNRRTLRSMKALQEGAAAIGTGDLAYAIPVTSDDEVGELTGSFNRMAADLATVTASRADLEREVAERRRAEEALLTHAQAVDNAYDAIFTADPDMVLRTWNRGAERIFGYGADEVIGLTTDFLATQHPPGVSQDEMDSQLTDRGFWSGEVVSRRKDGSDVTTLATATLVRDGTGTPIGFTATHHDITERKEAEETLKRYAAELEVSNEELQRYAYVASHDLQEPLRSIVSFSQLLERRYKGQLGQDADDYIQFIVEGGRRMQQLILDLLQVSRIETQAKPMAATDANETVGDVIRSLAVTLREAGATVTVASLPVVTADAAQLEQVFTNLISNAVKYHRPGVPPEVRVSASRLDGSWEFAVQDNGIGIEKEYFDRIFEMFRRLHTKEEYEGTGIGLAVVKKIITRHGGRVRVESTPGKGTTFFFTMPAA